MIVRHDSAALRLAALVQSSEDAIVSKDLNGIVESWNPAAERMFGYSAEEMIGRSIRTIVPPDRQDEEDGVLARIRAGETVDHYETIRLRKDGREVVVSLTVSPIREPGGEIIGASTIARDITERRRLERSTLLLGAIVEWADDAIISKDLDGVVQSWNRAAERMFGYTSDEAVGRSLASLIIPADRQGEEVEVLTRVREGLVVEHYETMRRRKDGSLVEISITVSPVRDSHGQIVGASKIARDVGERNELIRQVERASRMKDEFLATLSHELRTPLNAIMGYARIVKQLAADDRMSRAAQALERNGQSLSQLVSDILDMSAVSAGKTRLAVERCNVAAIIDEALSVIAPAADAKRLSVERDIPAEGAELVCDARRMQQVFWNLLSNAVKFTPTGGTVRIALQARSDDLAVTVSDTGIGMDAAFLPHVFQRFTQADTGTTREFGGIGLGLALVRHFVTLHGGTVKAHSDGPGRGSTFEVVFPRFARLPQTAELAALQ